MCPGGHYDVFMTIRRRRWTPTEHEALAAWYPIVSAKRLQELLPGRTEKAIREEGSGMGLKKHPERLAELGRENVAHRWHPEVFRTPTPPPQ